MSTVSSFHDYGGLKFLNINPRCIPRLFAHFQFLKEVGADPQTIFNTMPS
jgi:hypothetical protein